MVNNTKLTEPSRDEYLNHSHFINENGYNPEWYKFYLTKTTNNQIVLFVEETECKFHFIHRVSFQDNKIRFQYGNLDDDIDVGIKTQIWVE